MIKSVFQALFFFVFCFSVFLPNMDLLVRVSVCLLFGSFYSFFSSSQKDSVNSSFPWISSTKQPITASFLSLCFLFLSFLTYYLLPDRGILIEWQSEKDNRTVTQSLDLDSFEILPSHFPESLTFQDHYEKQISCRFYLDQPITKLVFLLNRGEAIWLVDGVEFARHLPEGKDRYLTIFKDLSAGSHTLECFLKSDTLPPSLKLFSSSNPGGSLTLVKGPFTHPNYYLFSLFSYLNKTMPRIFLFLAFFFLLPLSNFFLLHVSNKASEYPYAVSVFCLLICSVVFYLIQNHIFEIARLFYEADEAAFGLMAQSLLLGQSPPVFHYGQHYQGTLETFPLALFLLNFSSSAFGLHLLPFLWKIGFLIISVILFWKFGDLKLGLLSLFLFVIGGLHYHWIFSKTWFGYSFSLLIGAFLWLIVLISHQRGRITPGLALFWSLLSHLSFYSLPISFPFIIFTGFSLSLIPSPAFTRLFERQRTLSFENLPRLPKVLFQHLLDNGFIYCLLFFILFSFPYSFQIVLEGRSLPPPRISGEHPLFDRFIRECLPVLMGARTPYAQQHDLPKVFLGYLPSFFFLLSLFFFPFLYKRCFSSLSVFSKSSVSLPIWFFSLFTILLVSFSSFGVWPWYAIPLYWSLPLLLFTFFRGIWFFSPALSVGAIFIYFLSLISGLQSYSFLDHQPLSLSQIGFKIPTDFEKIKNIVKNNEIRFLICDQGYDVGDYGGKDWLGECIVFDSNYKIIAVDRLSRRIPSYAEETIHADRVGYLFHKDFFYYNPDLAVSDLYAPLTLSCMDVLFGENLLNFDRYDCDPYILYLPKKNQRVAQKSKWKIESSYPHFLSALMDQNISVRAYNPETFWSSDRIPSEGAWLKIILPQPTLIDRVVLFHGTKISDVPEINKVTIKDDQGKSRTVGSLQFTEEARSSVLVLNNPQKTSEVLIQVEKPRDDHWWTIFELWVQ